MLKVLSTFKSKPPSGHSRFGRANAWSLRTKNRRGLARKVMRTSDELRRVSDRQLLQISKTWQQQAISHSKLYRLMLDAYAVVREAARRAHCQAHYEVQVVAGIELFDGGIAEMQTGEGKTLAALLPAYLFSLVGKGCHVVTANDYLAQRDAEFASAVFERLGMSVGCLFDSQPRNKRKSEYDADITYGTAREFGFDFLKDRLAGREASSVQREHFFALVDEADSVMIDDARTPLLIAGPADEDDFKQEMIRACHQVSIKLGSRTDFELNHDRRSTTLTKHGCLSVLKLCHPRFVHTFGSDEIYRQVENSLCANYLFGDNRHYVVDNGQVAIVDESTGRIADGRKWQNGLHQAVEAKAGVAITAGTQTMAKVTVQSYFRRYVHLAGLTGTAQQVAGEFKKVYGLRVATIPTRKTPQRNGAAHRIFRRYDDKAQAIAIETAHRLIAGQAVLIGTPSVTASQRISEALSKFEIEHQVLNCLEHERESKIIEQAGKPGRVTVATNMAGRGTDIDVDEQVLNNGGLHIIATAKHSSSRIDRQLIGRTARQGKPGSYQFFLSLEDELFTTSDERPTLTLGSHLQSFIKKQYKPEAQASKHCRTESTHLLPPTGDHETQLTEYSHDKNSELDNNWIKVFNRAQSKIERLQEQQRLKLLEQEKNRNKLCLQMGLDPCLEMLDE